MSHFFWDTLSKGVQAKAAAAAAVGDGDCDVPADYRDDKKSTAKPPSTHNKIIQFPTFFVPFNHIGSLHCI